MSLRLFHLLFISFVILFSAAVCVLCLWSGSYGVLGYGFGLQAFVLICYFVSFVRKCRAVVF